jgi:hypothetical protein
MEGDLPRALRNSVTPTTQGRWANLSDEALLEVDFLSQDPTALPNVQLELSPTDEVPEVEFAYDTSETIGAKVRCIHCRFENHNRGFVLQFENGDRILVGGTCGKKRYGADFQRIERDFDVARQRAGYLRRRNQTLAHASTFLNALERLPAHPMFGAYRRVKGDFNRSMGPLARALHDLGADGALYLPTKVRDFDAEDRRYEKWERQMASLTTTELAKLQRQGKHLAPKGHIFRDSEQPHWKVQGLDFFRSVQSPDIALLPLSQRAGSALAALASIESTRISEMRQFFQAMNGLLDTIETQTLRLREMALALDLTNISKIAEWVQRRLDKHYQFDGLVLRHTSEGALSEFRVPQSIGLPDLSFLNDFRLAMNEVRDHS